MNIVLFLILLINAILTVVLIQYKTVKISREMNENLRKLREEINSNGRRILTLNYDINATADSVYTRFTDMEKYFDIEYKSIPEMPARTVYVKKVKKSKKSTCQEDKE